MPTVAIHRLEPSRRADFWTVHRTVGCDGCSCVAWWVPTWEEWGARTAAENAALREALFARGEDDGYLVYVDGEPAGWAQVGPRDRLDKLRTIYRLPPDPETWAISCISILPCFRGQGLGDRLLTGIVADLAARGVTRIEGFPVHHAPGDHAGDLWTGTVGMFTRAGFVVVAGTSQPVMRWAGTGPARSA